MHKFNEKQTCNNNYYSGKKPQKKHFYKHMITKTIKGAGQIKKKKKPSGFGKLIIGSIFASP